MKPELEQGVTDVLNHPTVQKGAATVLISTGFATMLDLIPDILAILTSIAGLIVFISIYRKNKAETRKLNIQAEILETKERQRKEEMQVRFERGDPCRRCTDEIAREIKESDTK
ncbi:hypothetical protein KAR91_32030 [Candidatus Pacearchaeota archaeon]|nr:hypothetical protein [Candidatus Pacearchaeota archaeon]